ncbi:MAG: phage antirepressor protein [Candidatus Magasanikbacteria bacterium]|nr:phage antirepressor protein [Candidatus Magasanikbacteria bacterium]
MDETKIAIFKGKHIRKIFYQKEWWFSVNDIIEALTDSHDPAQYFKRLKERDEELAKLTDKGGVQIVPPLMLDIKTAGGAQKAYCWHTEGIFRLIQSIPSPKAEPFKRWLAKVGYERVQEIENPELGQKRTRMLYKLKGYPDSWIEQRMRGIEIRETLTDEWNKHGVKEQKEYEILTAEIAQATFGLTPSQHKKVKGLKRENLRDHMSDLELIFSMLGEAATTEITKVENPVGFDDNKKTAKRGGGVAAVARLSIEKETGKKVVSPANYLPIGKKQSTIDWLK